MSKQEKKVLDIRDILQQLELDEARWHQFNDSPKITVKKQLLIDTTKRTVKLARRIII